MTTHDGAVPDPRDAGDLHDAPTQMDVGASTPASESPPEPSFSYPGGLDRLADRYQLEEPIASGGAAIVWRAFDDVLSRSVAIKLLHPHLAGDPTTVERFRLESINAARLTHTNVVQIYDTGQQADIVYLVMEYVDGPSLRDVLRERSPLDPQVVAALGEQVASALGEAHSQGVVHRDVKPANILLTSDGVAKVADFGIAKALSSSQATLTSPGTVVGTAAYVAPEQLEGSAVDARADVYALGVVLYECLTGRPAFQGDTPTATAAARLTQDLLPPRQIRADVPRSLDEIVVRATRRDPDLRFSDGAALAAALQPLVRSKPSDVTAMLLAELPGTHARSRGNGEPTPSGGVRVITPSSVPATRGEYGRRLLAAFVGGLLLALLAFLGTQALRNSDTLAADPDSLEVRAAGVVDPFDLSGQFTERNEEVPHLHDGDPGTAWRTETYAAPLQDIKRGVGVWFDLGEPVTVHTVDISSVPPGARIEIYRRDDQPIPEDAVDRDRWGSPLAAELIDSEESIEVEGTGRFWLLWITELPTVDGEEYRVSLREVTFHGDTS
jgi:eukaryotic-like serine/threonine-protein kinase